jgi:transposase
VIHYRAPGLQARGAECGSLNIAALVKRNELHKFVVLPKRWIVERTLAWISRNRTAWRATSTDTLAPSQPSYASP